MEPTPTVVRVIVETSLPVDGCFPIFAAQKRLSRNPPQLRRSKLNQDHSILSLIAPPDPKSGGAKIFALCCFADITAIIEIGAFDLGGGGVLGTCLTAR